MSTFADALREMSPADDDSSICCAAEIVAVVAPCTCSTLADISKLPEAEFMLTPAVPSITTFCAACAVKLPSVTETATPAWPVTTTCDWSDFISSKSRAETEMFPESEEISTDCPPFIASEALSILMIWAESIVNAPFVFRSMPLAASNFSFPAGALTSTSAVVDVMDMCPVACAVRLPSVAEKFTCWAPITTTSCVTE